MKFSVVTVLLILTLKCSLVLSCTCQFKNHLQSDFCSSDLVTKAKVVKANRIGNGIFPGSKIEYELVPEKVYQNKPGVPGAKEKIHVLSHNFIGSCTQHLREGSVYLITAAYRGNAFWTDSCMSNRELNSLTWLEVKGVEGWYKEHCDKKCVIENCYESLKICMSINHGPDKCIFRKSDNTFQNCHSKFSLCHRKPDGKCGWMLNKDVKKCVLDACQEH